MGPPPSKFVLQIKALHQSIDSIEVKYRSKCMILKHLRICSQSIHSIVFPRKPLRNMHLHLTSPILTTENWLLTTGNWATEKIGQERAEIRVPTLPLPVSNCTQIRSRLRKYMYLGPLPDRPGGNALDMRLSGTSIPANHLECFEVGLTDVTASTH